MAGGHGRIACPRRDGGRGGAGEPRRLSQHWHRHRAGGAARSGADRHGGNTGRARGDPGRDAKHDPGPRRCTGGCCLRSRRPSTRRPIRSTGSSSTTTMWRSISRRGRLRSATAGRSASPLASPRTSPFWRSSRRRKRSPSADRPPEIPDLPSISHEKGGLSIVNHRVNRTWDPTATIAANLS